MAFNQSPINYAAQYGRALQTAYPYLSYYADLWNQGESSRFRPLNGKTVYIPVMTTSGARAANRDQITGTFNRNFNIDWQAMTLTMDREWDTLIDPIDVVESNDVATIANVTRVFNEQQKVPEMDAYMSAKLAGFAASFGGTSSAELTSASILTEWDKALEYMTNQRVNRDRVRCKITPAAYKLLKQATGMTRFIEVTNGIRDVDRNIARLDGVSVEEVPADMMKTAYTFTEGWAIASGAVQINFILYDPDALAAPIVYDVAMMSPGSAQTKGKDIYYERYYYDVFALEQRKAGVYAHIASAPSAGALTVTSVAGTETSGDSKITVSGDGIFPNSGLIAEGEKLVYTINAAAVTVNYGAAPDGTKDWVDADNGRFIANGTSGYHITVALVNKQTGLCVASGDTTLVVKA